MRSGSAQDRLDVIGKVIERVALTLDSIEMLVNRSGLLGTFEIEGSGETAQEAMVLSVNIAGVRKGHQLRLVVPGPTTLSSEPSPCEEIRNY